MDHTKVRVNGILFVAPNATAEHAVFIVRNFRTPDTRPLAITRVQDLFKVDKRRAFLIARVLWNQAVAAQRQRMAVA
ncbi:hypothetical protein ABZY06_33770 [Streptomyces sp. NPDC006540]|uniref:hypothetical protein n=1 Tax=Streptomyces sp. NPDC006540 TaxID=3155353 RepID=UPI0033AEB613